MAAIALSFPLERKLAREIEHGRPKPLGYPLPNSVVEALKQRLKSTESVELLLAGRSSMLDDDFDVSIWLSSHRPLPRTLVKDISSIVRREMNDHDLVVEVRSLKETWDDGTGE